MKIDRTCSNKCSVVCGECRIGENSKIFSKKDIEIIVQNYVNIYGEKSLLEDILSYFQKEEAKSIVKDIIK